MELKKIFYWTALCSMLAACSTPTKTGGTESTINLESGWKFSTGDNPKWADPAFDDSGWKDILVDRFYELQDWRGYDGFSWYRKTFRLPSSLKESGLRNDSIRIFLGMIDDFDQTFLNGRIIGIDAKNMNEGQDTSGFAKTRASLYNIDRCYKLAVNDPRILWNQENTIAIRVYDPANAGGVYSIIPQNISLFDLRDMLSFDFVSSPFQLTDCNWEKVVTLKNKSPKDKFSGSLSVQIKAIAKDSLIFETSKSVEISGNESVGMEFEFAAALNEPCLATYSFIDNSTKRKYEVSQEVPYILTPKPAETPKITGAKVFGAHPGNPFSFHVTATGNKPMSYSAKDLPKGLTLDARSGKISGTVKNRGEHICTLMVKNEKGEDSRELKIVIDDMLSLTPPMGWNSWNCWGLSVDAQKVEQAAEHMVNSGLADHGWTYINIDDGWQSPQRKPDGTVVPNEKFPDMKKLGESIHDKGLKFGIYSGPGEKTCGGYLASYRHEFQDAKTWESWGVDYLKYDYCTYTQIAGPKQDLNAVKKPFKLMNESLGKLSRDMVYCICPFGLNGSNWQWCTEVGGNLWRNTFDITDDWPSMSSNGFNQANVSPDSRPGAWQDPDMMLLGWVGWGPSLHPTTLTVSEQYTHVSLWCLLSAPLFLGTDLSRLDDFTLSLLTNDEVLAVDQDPLGKPAKPVYQKDQLEIWVKELEDGSKAVGLFNRSRTTKKITVNWEDLKLAGKQVVRDLWRQKKLGEFGKHFETEVFAHGVVLLKVTANK